MNRNVLKLAIAITILITVTGCKEKTETALTTMHSGHHPATGKNYADSVNAGIIAIDTLNGSPVRVAMAFIGSNHVHIEYGSPGVRGRVIWGGLVAYDHVWATGAHHATSIEFSRNVQVGDSILNRGKYALFSVPGKTTWEVIINKNWDQHLTDEYRMQDDRVRVTVTPEILEVPVQRLTYRIEKVSNQEGLIVMEWEKIRIKLPFKTR